MGPENVDQTGVKVCLHEKKIITQHICDSKNVSSKRDAIHKFKLRVLFHDNSAYSLKEVFFLYQKKNVIIPMEANIHRKININHKIVKMCIQTKNLT